MKRLVTRSAGFTMVELITVMVLLGVLAAIAVPRLMGSNVTGAAAHADNVASALRLAQKTAVARRRTVCLDSASGALRIRRALGPGDCDAQLDGVDDNLFASSDADLAISGAPPTLRFGPDGSITDDGGAQIGPFDLAITLPGDQTGSRITVRTIHVDGRTGYVN